MKLYNIEKKKTITVNSIVLSENEEQARIEEIVKGTTWNTSEEEIVVNVQEVKNADIQEEVLNSLKNVKMITETELEQVLEKYGFDILDDEGTVDSASVMEIAISAGLTPYRLDNPSAEKDDTYIFWNE